MKAQAGMAEWMNVGLPTDETIGSIAREGSQGYFRVVSVEKYQMNDVSQFQLTFNSTWSAATHPDMFPGNPHFSGLIGATHNQNGQLWEPRSLASPGIESMAENGSKSPLMNEMQQAIQMG
jgi:hypothetical protein